MPTVRFTSFQYAALNNPFDHFAFFAGVGSGKTFTGSHFALNMIQHHPEMTGFIGANTYDQLSQATLKEFFYWLEFYGFEFVVDCRPPKTWNVGRTLKKYSNTMHVRNMKTGMVTLIFTRVLSDENPLRGIEFSWYWLDETRDTPEITHDVVISRMRETPNFIKGIITTTTNGEDWTYKRFVLKDPSDKMYGSMHVPTYENVKSGILTEKYYQTMLKTYSPLMAEQELFAKHVNVFGGKAYYAAGDHNRRRIAPWGEVAPNRDRPLVIGCDFNFNPAPCVWMIGQVGPPWTSDNGKVYYGDCVHWFGEISGVNMSTEDMCYRLLSQYPDFFYRVFGDVSGGVGTTSNAGETDYNQMSTILAEAGANFSIDYYQNESRINPKVRNRVENMNGMFRNALGEIRQTYDPVMCPHFDGDLKMVGWKETVNAGRGKLDNGGDVTRTHASDGAGYAVWKLFPPIRRAAIVEAIPSALRTEAGILR